MVGLIYANSEINLVKTVCSIVVKGHWDNLLKPKIGSLITSSVINRSILLLSPYGFSIYFSFFKWVESIPHYKHSLQSSWTMICILTKQRHFKTAQNLLEKIAQKDFLSSPPVLNALVNNRFNDPEVNAHILSWLVIFYANSKMNPDAIQVFEHMRVCRYKPHLHACTSLLNSLVKEKMTDTVWKIYKKMVKIGVSPNLHIYNVMIHSCCKLRDVEKAESLLSEMESKNIFPDYITYNTLISLYCKKGMHYEALCVQERMKKGGFYPDIVTYNSLIYSYCREGRMREAFRLFQEIKGVNPNQVTYTTLIDGYCRANNLDEALRLRKVMEAKELYPGVVTYNVILRKLCESGRIRDANKLLMEMGEKKIEPDNVTCNTLINAYCKIGDMASAIKVKGRMVESGLRPDQFTYKALIHGFCKSKDPIGAKETILQMVNAGFAPYSCVFSWLVDFYCEKNDEEAILRFPEELGMIVDISIYRAIIRRLCKNERVEFAERVFVMMKKNGILPDAVVYVNLACAYLRVGDAFTASDLLDEMYKRRVMVTLQLYKSMNDSYGEDSGKLDVLWDFVVRKGLISKPVQEQIRKLKMG